MKDYSDYLNRPGMLDFIEKSWTTECKDIHDSYARAVNDTIKKYKLKTVIEVGCGSGEVAKRLPNDTYYIGIDQNEECLLLAEKKNAYPKVFRSGDIRTMSLVPGDLVCTFGVLKHFGLHEWGKIFKKVCSLGRYLIFNMPIAEKTKDDGTDFHHVWINEDELRGYININGFEILEIRNDFPVEPIFICRVKEKIERICSISNNPAKDILRK